MIEFFWGVGFGWFVLLRVCASKRAGWLVGWVVGLLGLRYRMVSNGMAWHGMERGGGLK